jgi:hypothetical protein
VNRQSVLIEIRRQLRKNSAASSSPLPLGELVPRIAARLRQHTRPDKGAQDVLPVGIVAAFIDGAISEQDSNRVCAAIQNDNSVLAELIAGVRAVDAAHELPELSQSLQGRLLALAVESAAGSDRSISGIELRVIPPAKTPASPRSHTWTYAVAALAIAATIFLAIRFVPRSTSLPKQNDVVIQPKVESPPPPHVSPILEEAPRDAQEFATEKLVETPSPETTDPITPPVMIPESPKESIAIDSPKFMDKSNDAPEQAPKRVVRWGELRWTDISGLLAQDSKQADLPEYRAGENWRGVAEDDTSFRDNTPESPVKWATLPLSRAAAQFSCGGKLVISRDSGVLVDVSDPQKSAAVEFQHGEVAFLEMPADSILKVATSNQKPTEFHWRTPASLVLSYTANGVEAQITGGQIAVNGEPREELVMVLRDGGNAVFKENVRRLPLWTQRSIESIPMSKAILGQLNQAPNLMSGVGQELSELLQNGNPNVGERNRMELLANWQATLAEKNLYRLASNQLPIVRMAALQRLVELPEWDPRYNETWQATQRGFRDPQRFEFIKQVSTQVRQRRPLDAGQLDLLVVGLESADLPGRAIHDYLLRRALNAGPDFDPAWSGQTHQRGVNVWRQFIQRRNR